MRRFSAALIASLMLSLLPARLADAVEFVASYPVQTQPFGIVSDPTDGRIYVANSGTRTPTGGIVSVVDPATGTVGSLATTMTSNLLALDAGARRLYSSNSDASGSNLSLDVFDLGNGARVQSFAGIGGLGVALDEARSRLYASSGRFLVSIDTSTFDMNVVSAPFGQTWFGVAVDRTLGHVYVTNISFPSPSLVVLDADTLRIIGNVSLPTSPRFALAVDEATHRVFFGGNADSGSAWTVSMLDGATFALATVAFDAFPSGIVHDAVGHRIWVTAMGGQFGSPPSTLTALDDATLATQSQTTLPWQPSLAAFGRDGRLYVSGWSAGVVGALNVNEPANRPPVIDRVTVTPPLPATNDTLSAVVEAHDPDGDQVTVTYQWTVNGRVLVDETSSTLDLSKPGNGDRNDDVCLTVTASDAHAISATGTWCQGVRDSAPVATVSLDSVTPATDAVLHATVAATDVDGDLLSYAFTWSVNGFAVRTTSGLVPADELDLALPGRNKGDVVSVTVVVSDGFTTSDPATATAVVRNSAPTVSVALNDTRPWKHDVILASTSSADRDGDVLNFTFTWRVNGVVTYTSDGAEWSTFDLNAFGVPNRAAITVDVVATDGSATATASAEAVVSPPGQ